MAGGHEGVALKRKGVPYPRGRSNDWVKIKLTRSASCIVVGATAGEGSRADRFGALELALMDGTDIVRIGKVGSGFSKRDVDECYLAVQVGDPFVVDVTFQ
jgi:bifunctional non-homologous end joining protein LigD